MEFKMTIAVRSDLDISEGKLAAQVAHAAVMCTLESRKERNDWVKRWVSEGQKKVILKVSDEEELLGIEKTAKRKDLVACVVEDAGHTELPRGTRTCVGIGPGPDSIIDEITGSLPLW
jgi:PTH2 family peptidyl-tRNA hydrolase